MARNIFTALVGAPPRDDADMGTDGSYMRLADAALDAMMEPTEGMRERVFIMIPDMHDPVIAIADFERWWIAAIRAAKDGK